MPTCVFGLKPNFFGSDIYQAFSVAFQPQRLDVRIFNVFFALRGLQLLVKSHGLCSLTNQTFSRNAQAGVYPPHHGKAQRTFAIQDLINAIQAPNHWGEVFCA